MYCFATASPFSPLLPRGHMTFSWLHDRSHNTFECSRWQWLSNLLQATHFWLAMNRNDFLAQVAHYSSIWLFKSHTHHVQSITSIAMKMENNVLKLHNYINKVHMSHLLVYLYPCSAAVHLSTHRRRWTECQLKHFRCSIGHTTVRRAERSSNQHVTLLNGRLPHKCDLIKSDLLRYLWEV